MRGSAHVEAPACAASTRQRAARIILFIVSTLLLCASGARAVDRGQFADVPEDIRAWFKSVVSPSGVPCCDISDGHRTSYEVRRDGYWVPIDGLWWQVPARAVIRDRRNPVGEAVVWYVRLHGAIVINCFVPADAA